MKKLLRTFLWLVAILAVGVPVSFLTTFLLVPLWSWIETTYGIESIGHSGPAEWCYGAMLGLYLLVCAIVYGLVRQRRQTGKPSAS